MNPPAACSSFQADFDDSNFGIADFEKRVAACSENRLLTDSASPNVSSSLYDDDGGGLFLTEFNSYGVLTENGDYDHLYPRIEVEKTSGSRL